MDATSLATVWATIALVIFIALCIYLKVPGMVSGALDKRAERIRNELEEAKRLREEAQALLAEYQKKRKEAEQEAAEIVEIAKREAVALADEAKRKTEDYVARRTTMAEQKIAQAERDAVSEVRARAVDLAVEAARKVLGDKTDSKADADLFKKVG
jgi:F-type H+-transporting ATPase subunit b